MENYTLTFSESAKGWQSFYSYKPEKMIGMNNKFYSFKNGRLYVHNSENVGRNFFYGEQYTSKITGVINENPYDVKTFKTFSLDSTAPWDCTFTTDLGSGYIDSEWFSLKEGDYFAHIRNTDNSLELRSAQGIGTPTSIDSVSNITTLKFSFKIDSIISVGDKVYSNDGSNNTLAGTVTDVRLKTITIDTSSGAIPSVNDYIFYVKNNTAESYGATGYFLKYEIENNSTNFVEIFSIGSNLFKSYP